MKLPLKNLEEILLENRLASKSDLERAHQARKPGQSLLNCLIDLGAIGSRRLARVLARAYCLPFQADVDEKACDGGLLAMIPINYAVTNRVLVFGTDGASIVVAIADPSNFYALDDLAMVFRLPVHPVVVPFDVLDQVIARAYDSVRSDTAAPAGARGRIVVLEERQLEAAADQLLQEGTAAAEGDDPLVGFVDALLWEATNKQLTEIQIEPGERNFVVRFQIGTARCKELSPPKRFEAAIISRIKTMAMLNPSDGYLPQDGHLRLRVGGRVIAVRVSVSPGAFGERVVLRFNGGCAQHLLSVVEDFEEAVSALPKLGDEVSGIPLCPHCGESIVVAEAIFCKECGGRVRNTPGSAKTGVIVPPQAPTVIATVRGHGADRRSHSGDLPNSENSPWSRNAPSLFRQFRLGVGGRLMSRVATATLLAGRVLHIRPPL